jgi:hypothetical protein
MQLNRCKVTALVFVFALTLAALSGEGGTELKIRAGFICKGEIE